MTKSQKVGIRWRWLFLLGGVIYLINTFVTLINGKEINEFLGMELGKWSYALLQLGISALLISLYFKYRRQFNELIKEEVLRQAEAEEGE